MEHDLAVNDFRLELEASCWAAADVTLETWVPESEYWVYPDQIIYKISEDQVKRKIHPDGFFTLTTVKPLNPVTFRKSRPPSSLRTRRSGSFGPRLCTFVCTQPFHATLLALLTPLADQ